MWTVLREFVYAGERYPAGMVISPGDVVYGEIDRLESEGYVAGAASAAPEPAPAKKASAGKQAGKDKLK